MQWPADLTRPENCRGYSSFIPLNAPKTSSFSDALTPDDKVSAQDIPPGTYTLSIIFYTENKVSPDTSAVAHQPKAVAAGELTVTIPPTFLPALSMPEPFPSTASLPPINLNHRRSCSNLTNL